MFRGLRTANYHVDDLQKAKEWYSDVLSVKPFPNDERVRTVLEFRCL